MAGINMSRVLVGGLAAGVVMNVIDGTVNGFLLSSQWAAETNALNSTLMARVATSSMVGWIVYDFLIGILTVWLYAAMRPRFGPGASTAIKAGFVMWLITHIAFASFVFMGLYSSSLMMLSAAGGLVSAIAGAHVGGMLYQEEGSPAAARA